MKKTNPGRICSVLGILAFNTVGFALDAGTPIQEEIAESWDDLGCELQGPFGRWRYW